MKNQWLVVILMLFSTVLLFGQATDLFISEYVEGTSYNKAIEIYNGTGAAVDLSHYSLKKQTNGAGAYASELLLTGTLPNDDVYVIVSNASGGTNLANQPFVDLPTASQAVNFNGNDAVALFKDGIQLDEVGIFNDPSNWGINMTLVRNPTVAMPLATFDVSQWTQYPVDTFTYLGDHEFSGGGTEPVIVVNAPNGGETWYVDHTYTISWSSANITGNVKIELSNNGVFTTLADDLANTGNWQWAIPATQTQGTQFKIKVSKQDGSVSDLSNEFFTIGEIVTQTMPNLAALRAANADGTTNYLLTGEAILTYKQTYRNKKYIQDSTGAIELDDPNGIITTVYNLGDGISNILGTLAIYHNMLQFTPLENPGAATSTGNVVTPQIVTLLELNTNFENYESELVTINHAQFDGASGSFATGTNYPVSDPTGSIVFRSSFFEADYIGQAVPSGQISITAITFQYDTAYQITSRSMADFGTVANQDEINDTAPIVLHNAYPNPFSQTANLSFSVKTPQQLAVSIYNTKGQLVRSIGSEQYTAGEHNLVWNGLDERGNQAANGVYYFKVNTGNSSAVKKVVLVK